MNLGSGGWGRRVTNNSPGELFCHIYQPLCAHCTPDPGQWGLLWFSNTGDRPAMVLVREWTCPKPQGRWHLWQ